jgi:beta-lactamase class D
MPLTRFQTIASSAAIAALFVSLQAPAKPLPNPPEHYFGEYGYCALILGTNRYDDVWLELGERQCQQPLSPCSTFKLPNALIGLQTGVVTGPDDVKKWDGKQRNREAANRDHTLQSAIRESIPWYFQALARDVGEERMATWLEKLDYGNRDISAGIDRFWLGSSLEIDAHGQMKLLRDLWRGGLPFKPEYQQQLREMIALDSTLDGRLYGKTGSCLGGEDQQPPDHGWFIGWVDWNNPSRKQPATTFFVINITGSRAWGHEAKKIALDILQDLQPAKAMAPDEE